MCGKVHLRLQTAPARPFRIHNAAARGTSTLYPLHNQSALAPVVSGEEEEPEYIYSGRTKRRYENETHHETSDANGTT